MHESTFDMIKRSTKKMVDIIGIGEQIDYRGYFLLYFFVYAPAFYFCKDSELFTLISSVIKPETPPSRSSL